MSEINKKELSEIDICDLYITPAIIHAGWDQMSQIRQEVTLTPGPVIVRGNMSARNKKKMKFADYVLSKPYRIPMFLEALQEITQHQRESRKTNNKTLLF